MVRPVTVAEVDELAIAEKVQAGHDGVGVTVYPVIAEPPSDPGAVQWTVTVPSLLAVAAPMVGLPGTVGEPPYVKWSAAEVAEVDVTPPAVTVTVTSTVPVPAGAVAVIEVAVLTV